MVKVTRHTVFFLVQCFILVLLSRQPLLANTPTPFDVDVILKEAKKLQQENNLKALNYLDKQYQQCVAAKDTLTSIILLARMADVHGHQANYKQSYDKLWKALLLTDAAKLEVQKADIHKRIGRYYSFYKRKEQALENFNLSLQIIKKLVQTGQLDEAHLADNYYTFCATYRELNEPELARIYLDSSYLYHQPQVGNTNLAYLKFEEANLLLVNQQYGATIQLLKEVIPYMEKYSPGYQVLVYTCLADAYKGLSQFEESEQAYQAALNFSRQYNSHRDFTPLIHGKLSDLYRFMGNFANAYEQIKIAKKLDEIFFDSRSPNNRPILEIQDAFRAQKEEQNQLLKEQRIAQLEQEEEVQFLQRIILIGLIFFLCAFGVVYFKHVRSRHHAEKQLIQKKKELEIQKANEVIELKNKELATSALKLIEKEEFIVSLKEKLSQGKVSGDSHEIQKIIRSISHNNAENWKEFETRFVSVNRHFYDRLKAKFPKLTQGDQKLCALVKLNFSSKDMAKLMGISVESVHTTRYRLRKKLKLSRDVNLTEFIARI